MKRKLMLFLGILGITISSLAFTGSSSQVNNNECPLRGTLECPQFPSCCE
ncbi:MAG: hypothetical protein DAHOPDDO_02170 [Ignavibacteriaceae bacterium]|nr:hypothetical protein [Ignavibacteriaceae bacterium]GIK61852.1 MAG: hypothetical protein BroJett017_27420 [Ignavibacteriota bacterium]